MQIIFTVLCLATVMFFGTVMHFMYTQMGLDSLGGEKYFRAYSYKMGASCLTFHCGTWMLGAVFPLWAYQRYVIGPCFIAAAVIGWLWYDLTIVMPGHIKLNLLATHCAMGEHPPAAIHKLQTFSNMRKGWSDGAWVKMHAI